MLIRDIYQGVSIGPVPTGGGEQGRIAWRLGCDAGLLQPQPAPRRKLELRWFAGIAMG